MTLIPAGIAVITCASSILSGVYQWAALWNIEAEGEEHKGLRGFLLVINAATLVSCITYQSIAYSLPQ